MVRTSNLLIENTSFAEGTSAEVPLQKRNIKSLLKLTSVGKIQTTVVNSEEIDAILLDCQCCRIFTLLIFRFDLLLDLFIENFVIFNSNFRNRNQTQKIKNYNYCFCFTLSPYHLSIRRKIEFFNFQKRSTSRTKIID